MKYEEYVKKLDLIKKLTNDLATDLERDGHGDELDEMNDEIIELSETITCRAESFSEDEAV